MFKSIISAAVLVVVSAVSIFSQINLEGYKEMPVTPEQEMPFFEKVYQYAGPYIPVETEVVSTDENTLIYEVETLTREQHDEMDSLSILSEIQANTPIVYKKTLPSEVIDFVNALDDTKLQRVLRQMKNTSDNYVNFVLNIKENFGENATYNDVSSRCGWGI